MSIPVVPDEQPPASVDSRLKSYLSRMFRYCRVAFDNLQKWTVNHVAITAPLYEEDPHEQYWHVIKDSAAGHMFFQNFVTPKPVTDGQPITGWDTNIFTPYHILTDLAAGTMTSTDTDYGLYNISIGCDLVGQPNETYFVQLFRNGVGTGLAVPIVMRGSLTSGRSSFAGTGIIYPDDVLDVRVIGVGASVANINWSVYRYINLGEFETGVENYMASNPTLPSNYGQGGML